MLPAGKRRPTLDSSNVRSGMEKYYRFRVVGVKLGGPLLASPRTDSNAEPPEFSASMGVVFRLNGREARCDSRLVRGAIHASREVRFTLRAKCDSRFAQSAIHASRKVRFMLHVRLIFSICY